MKTVDFKGTEIKAGYGVKLREEVDVAAYGFNYEDVHTVEDTCGEALVLRGSTAMWASNCFVVSDIIDGSIRNYEKSPIMKFFTYSHLPEHLQCVSKGISDVAEKMDKELNGSAEKSAGLRKLLEAKDCFVRAQLESTNK